MKAVTWQGARDIRVEEVPDPIIKEPTDAIIRVTTTGPCGSDLNLNEPLGTETFATHHLPLTDAPDAYAKFRDKEDGMIKVVFNPLRRRC